MFAAQLKLSCKRNAFLVQACSVYVLSIAKQNPRREQAVVVHSLQEATVADDCCQTFLISGWGRDKLVTKLAQAKAVLGDSIYQLGPRRSSGAVFRRKLRYESFASSSASQATNQRVNFGLIPNRQRLRQHRRIRTCWKLMGDTLRLQIQQSKNLKRRNVASERHLSNACP